METERPGDQPEAARRDPAPAQVAHDHVAASHAIELAEHARDLAVVEVMQELRAGHEVDAVVGKGQGERIGARAAVQRAPTDATEALRTIDAEHDERHAPLARPLASG